MDNSAKIRKITTYAMMSALMCICGPLSIPIGPIPVSLTIFIICLAVYIIGMKGTLISYSIYLLLGLVGLPVFSGFQGGPAKLAGPTGGYLIGFIALAFISGLIFEKSNGNTVLTLIGMILGIAVDYVFGTMWFMHQTHMGLAEALGVCVIPFIPIDLCKAAVATVLGRLIRKPLLKQGLIS